MAMRIEGEGSVVSPVFSLFDYWEIFQIPILELSFYDHKLSMYMHARSKIYILLPEVLI